jgi:hypothetical protein
VAPSDSGRIPARVIVIQLVVIAGLIIFFKLYLPRMEKSDAAARLQERESRITELFDTIAGKDAGSASSGQTLRSTPSVEEVEQRLGAPDTSTTDYAGGLHLTWTGARHSLMGSFYRGRLYSLTFTDRSTGQAETISGASNPS